MQSALFFNLIRLVLCYGTFMTLVLLEDRAGVTGAMLRAQVANDSDLAVEILPSAPEFIDWMESDPREARLFSLDQHLELSHQVTEQPGMVRGVGNGGVSHPYTKPVIIYSAYASAAQGIESEPFNQSVSARRVMPYDGFR